MWPIAVASAVSLTIGYLFGFYVRDLWDRIHKLEKRVKTTVSRQPSVPQSSILEPPLSPSERVAREHEEMLERLNP